MLIRGLQIGPLKTCSETIKATDGTWSEYIGLFPGFGGLIGQICNPVVFEWVKHLGGNHLGL